MVDPSPAGGVGPDSPGVGAVGGAERRGERVAGRKRKGKGGRIRDDSPFARLFRDRQTDSPVAVEPAGLDPEEQTLAERIAGARRAEPRQTTAEPRRTSLLLADLLEDQASRLGATQNRRAGGRRASRFLLGS